MANAPIAPMSTDQRSAVILAAFNAAGPVDEQHPIRLAGAVASITAALRPGSALAQIADDVWGANQFVGHIVSVGKERSTRALIVLKTGTTETYEGFPPGTEPLRSDRTDDRGGLGVATARLAQSLIGHKVLAVYVKEGFKAADGKSKSMRIAKFFIDLGLSDEPEAKQALAAYQQAMLARPA